MKKFYQIKNLCVVLGVCFSLSACTVTPKSTSPYQSQIKVPNKAVAQGGGLEAAVQAVVSGQQSFPANVPPVALSELQAAYGGRSTLWIQGERWTPQAQSAAVTLKQAYMDALNPEDYLPQNLNALPSKGSAYEMASYDLMLTAGMIRYLSDIKYGVSKRGQGGAGALLAQGLNSYDFVNWVESHRSQDPSYLALRRHLAGEKITTDADFMKFQVAMERIRRGQQKEKRTTGKYVRVNVPTFDLRAYDEGVKSMEMKVVVGKQLKGTPVIDDRITNIKFSPNWTAPDSIAKTLIERLREKPEKLEIFNIDVINKSTGQTVSREGIDWSQDGLEHKYRFVQKPGPKNLLGLVRFSLTNSQAIYLHDTPYKSAFELEARAFSSGCVRVERAADFASWLLQENGDWDPYRIEEAMNKGSINYVQLKKAVPLSFTYETVYVNEDGSVRVGRDVYGKDKELAQGWGMTQPSYLTHKSEEI